MKKWLAFTLLALLTAGPYYADAKFYVYTQDVGNRCRGLAVYEQDDFAVGINFSSYFSLQWYHNAPQGSGDYDCMKNVWAISGDSISLTWNWGIGIEYTGDRYIYQANQDDSTNVLVWDRDCNEVDRLELGAQHTTTEYPTALDLDANGYVYVAWYIDSDYRNQIEVYPPRSQWVNHKAPLVTSFEPGSYVCEGMCVHPTGTVIWCTNRSAPGSQGWVKRFVGSPQTGYAEDMNFSLSVPGYVRGIDVAEPPYPNWIFVCSDNNGYPAECVLIANANTGTAFDTLWTEVGPYHTSPYDVEYDPIGDDLYILHRYGWYVDKWHEFYPAVTMTSFNATAGQEMVELSWRVESEVNNAGFNLYRDGEKIAFVESQGNTDAPRTYTWVDKDVTAGVTYSYRIADVDLDGNVNMHDFVATAIPMATAGVPTEYWLSQNYPNPFNADTHIEFTLAQAGHTTLKIYNTTGQLVRTLVDEHLEATVHKVRWDGRNEYGEIVASGIYFYRLSSGKFAETKKMSFLR